MGEWDRKQGRRFATETRRHEEKSGEERKIVWIFIYDI
jgi:hypothetical protein